MIAGKSGRGQKRVKNKNQRDVTGSNQIRMRLELTNQTTQEGGEASVEMSIIASDGEPPRL